MLLTVSCFYIKLCSLKNFDVEHILLRGKSFELNVNPEKTQVIFIGSSRMLTKIDWNGSHPV